MRALSPRSVRFVLGWVAICAVAVQAAIAASIIAGIPDVLGSDWLWYRNGPDRLLAGQSLYPPEMLSGHYDQLSSALLFHWNQLPALATVLLPLVALGPQMSLAIWFGAMFATTVAAVVIVRPTAIAGRTFLALILLLGMTSAFTAAVVWSNFNAAAAFGVALVWVGVNRTGLAPRVASSLIVIGLTLAAMKVLPAVLLGTWLIVRVRRPMPVFIALGIVGALTLVPIAIAGPRVLPDFLTVVRNATIVPYAPNMSPAVLLREILPINLVAIATTLAGAIALTVGVLNRTRLATGLLLMMLAACAFTPNLWPHWYLFPIIGVFVALDGTTVLARFNTALLRATGA
jgi:hypothetical protein